MTGKKTLYTIRASLDAKTYRDIAIRGDQTLSTLAEAIVAAYDFAFDHAFGFYNNIDNLYDSTERYELFTDMGEPLEPDSRGVKKTTVDAVFQEDRRMLFLFDYGDEWIFLTECIGTQPLDSKERFPKLIGKTGDSPEQYPDEEDAEDENAA